MAKTTQDTRYLQTVRIGLGEAIQRLIAVEWRYRQGLGHVDEKLLDERTLLLEAMNHLHVDIGFDCNNDGVPDTMEIFKKAADTSCCRLMPYESSKKEPFPPAVTAVAAPKKPVRRSNSRRQDPIPAELPNAPVDVPVTPIPEAVVAPPKPEPKKKKGLFGLFGKKDG